MRFYEARYSNQEGHRTGEFFKTKKEAKAAVDAHNDSDSYKQGQVDNLGNWTAWSPAILGGSVVIPINADKLLYYLNYSNACRCGYGEGSIYTDV